MPVTHLFVNPKADGPDATITQPGDWNDPHVNGDLGLPLALTGAVAATRYVGGHATGAPTTGTFAVGDFVVTSTGKIFICTSAGSPGTWVQADVAAHAALATDAHDASAISILDTANDFTATNVETALAELQSDNEGHIAAADPHTGYILESLFSAAGELITSSGNDTPSLLAAGAAGQMLQSQGTSLSWIDYQRSIPFSKQGAVAVTTEGDSPPPMRWYNDTGRTLTFVAVRATATTAPAGSAMTIDVNVDGTTIMTGTKVVIADGTNTVKQTAFSTTTVADGHYISVNVDAVGSGTAGSNLTVTVWLKG